MGEYFGGRRIMREEEPRSLNERVERLEREVSVLRTRLEALSGSTVPEIPRTGKAGAEPVRTETPFAPDAALPSVVIPPPAAVPPPFAPVMPAPESKPLHSRSREEWETLIGGKLLNRIGALALILGMGFFLKHAFDNNWISETVRVLIGGGIGLLLLAGAWRFQVRGLSIFAQGLLGAGISILYLSVYAAHNFYHLVSLPAAFVLMSMVTTASLLQSLRYNSLAASLLGWCGGFLTPFLLASGEANEVGLFTYIALLDLGLLGILFRRPAWISLEPLTLLATYLVYFVWYGSYSPKADPALTLFFLTLFWAFFFALDLARMLTTPSLHLTLRRAMHALNAALFALGLQNLIDTRYPGWLPAAYLILGAVYFPAFLATRSRLAARGDAPSRQALTAVALLVLATGFHFSCLTLVTVWSLEAAALVWCGVYGNVPAVWKAGLALFGLAALRLYAAQVMSWPPSRVSFLRNEWTPAFGALAVSLGAAVFPMRRVPGEIPARIREILHYCWGAVLFILCTLETYAPFGGQSIEAILPFLALCWMAYALPMVWTGLRTRTEPVLYCGLGSAALAVIAGVADGLVAFDPITDFRPLLNPRALILVALMTGTALLSLRMRAIGSFVPRLRGAAAIFPLGMVFLAFSLLTGETLDYFRKSIALLAMNTGGDIAPPVDILRNLQQMTLSGVWMLYSIFLIACGMWRRLPALRIIAIALFGFTILKIFIYDLSFLEALYRIVSFLGLGVILLTVSYLYQRYKTVIFERKSPE